MKSQNVESVVQIGLGLILVILFLLAITGMYQVRQTNQSMSNVVHKNQLKIELAHVMRDSIRLREISLNKMLAMEDPFDRDEELLRFYDYAGIYRRAREQLMGLKMDAKEQKINDELTTSVRISQPLNKEAAELIAANDPNAKEAVFLASAQQQDVLRLLNLLVDIQHKRAYQAVNDGTDKYDRSLYLVIMFGVIIIIGAFFIVRKVSKYVASKNQELLNKNEELAKVSEVAMSANKTKSAFLATMSHEIRTPLTAIIGFAETSLDSDQTIKDRIGATKTIIRSGRHLLQIINDILDLSKIEANKLELEELELSPFELLADMESIIKPLAVSKGLAFKIEYEFPLPKLIISDPLRLKQILINLVSNAIKFTESGHVIIAVSFDSELKEISFNVIDSGIGLTETQMDRIFESFTQADSSTTRKYGGTGLGLSLSKELAQKLGGDLTVKSLKNTGSQFKLVVNAGHQINFDYVNNEKDIPETRKEEIEDLRPDKFVGKVLLAEDNKDNQRLLTHFVDKLGASITIADNGQVAISMAMKEGYDLILMDIQMPVLNGLDATRQLRRNGYRRPIVALTANAMKKDKEDCYEAGCDDFLTKPVDRKELYRVASQYLQKDGSSDALAPKLCSEILEDEPGLVDIVEKYCAELPEVLSTVKNLSDDRNWSELAVVIHQLKGTGGGLGFPVLTELAGKLEFQIVNEDYNEVEKLILDLDNVVRRIISPSQKNDNTNNSVKLVN